MENKEIKLNFSNYNYAFNNFYQNYMDVCIKLSEYISIEQLADVRKLISCFIYEYDYTLEFNKKESYRNKLIEISNMLNNDNEISKIQNRDFSIAANRIEYQHMYYNYFLLYLDIFGSFVSELAETFMPNTNIQKKLFKFSSNQPFFEKFIQHKQIVLTSLSEFKIIDFSKCYNKMITFYYAYSLFVNLSDRKIIDHIFSLLISFYLDKRTLNLLMVDRPSQIQINELSCNSQTLHHGLLYINSLMNMSFSSYDVLPKIQKKVYVDRTLI
jgi:hypothetical protein